MTRAHKLSIAGKTAIIAALMGGSSLSFAQDAAPTVTAPAPPARVADPVVEPAFTPPAAVRTLPNANDVVNPAAAQEAAAETASKRQANPAAKTPSKPRAAVPVRSSALVAPIPTVAPDNVGATSADIAPPQVDSTEPVGTAIEDTAAIAPIDEVVVEQDSGVSSEDMTLFGGLAAALAAIGLGAAFASRRRRRVVGNHSMAVLGATPEYAAPRPIREDPVFQQFATTPAPERVIQRSPVMTRPDVPVTDPLFSTPVIAGPITDPLFAPRNEVEKPITDPLFAKHDRFAGRVRPTETIMPRAPELVN